MQEIIDRDIYPFDSLSKKRNLGYSEKWNPIYVNSLESIVSKGLLNGIAKNTKKNIVYNLEYLEYIQLQIDELKLHSVIKKMLYKNYIIISMSIIECIFHTILKKNDSFRKRGWELVRKVSSNNFTDETGEYKLETNIYKKIIPVDDEMNFDSIIKKIEKKKFLDLEHTTFPYINKLKKLRNKVHLQINDHNYDNDWHNFNETDYLWMKYTLYITLTDMQLGNPNGKYLEFLKCNQIEMDKLKLDD